MTRSRPTYAPDAVSAPGETLKELLDERGMTQKELAARTGRPLKTINEIVKGKAAITPETAMQLERALGLAAAFWNEREARYRGHLARVAADRSAERWLGWLDKLPLKEMMKAGVLPETRLSVTTRRKLLDDALKFFGVASPEEWASVYQRPQAAYRRSLKRECDPAAIAVWLRQGELAAQESGAGPFDEKRFRAALAEIRSLTLVPTATMASRLRELCANAGVILALVPSIPRAHVSGAARWMHGKRALIQLSLYGRTNDRFWFTFFHEAGHILLHGRSDVFIDDGGGEGGRNQLEAEADSFASDQLIGPDQAARLPKLTATQIVSFAGEIGIHPGIVVGRMQHDKLLPYASPMNRYKISYKWTAPG